MSPLTIGRVSHERTLKILTVFLTILFFSGYAYFQARNLITGPTIVLNDLGTTILRTDPTVDVQGVAENVVILRLNGKEIHIDERGYFNHTIMLENGYTIMTLEAEDRYGRKTKVARSFVYTKKPEAQG